MQKKRNGVGVARANYNYFAGRKGQITMYIIMGLLLILGVAIIIAVQSEIVTFPKEEVSFIGKGKFERLITSCINDLGEDAIYRIGLQSGYLQVPQDLLIDRSIRLSPSNAIPYWAHGETLNIVPLSAIKKQIDQYIEANLRSCVLNLEPFQESFDLTELSQIISDTEIVKAKTLFNVRWNLAIKTKTGETVEEVINHVGESPIKLKQTYELASTIVNQEMIDLKLEDITQDLIALEHDKVPVAGYELTCSQQSWDFEELQVALKNLLRINIAQLQIEGNQFLTYPDELPYYSSHYVWDIGVEPNPDISVAFSYQDNFPTSIDVHPRNGNKLQSTSVEVGDLLSFFCMQNWKFVYDVTYPVVIDVRDEATGFSFKTAVTVHLKGNIPDRSGLNSPPTSTQIHTIADDQFCKTRKVTMTVYTFELIDDPKSGVHFKDPLDDVELTFNCLKYSCPSGKTEYDFAGMGDIAAQRTLFPYCAGAIMRGKKTGYKDGWQRVVTSANKEIGLDLIPVYNLPSSQISFVKHRYISDTEIGPAQSITDSTVLLTLTYDKPNKEQTLPGQPFHLSRVVFDPDSELNGKQSLEFLAKADFEYNLDIKLIQGEKIIGGYFGNWTADWQKLKDNQEVTFHLLDSGKTGTDQLDFILSLPEKTKLIPQPEIK
tara:strand:- start:83648 stop:85624 length:1977 start_codon:yes stop_codon:yes gene_type:complete